MNDLVTCPDCKAEAPPVWSCETCGNTYEPTFPTFPTFPSLIERVEHYLTENGWTQRNGFWSLPGFDLADMLPMRPGHALDVQLARDKEASK